MTAYVLVHRSCGAQDEVLGVASSKPRAEFARSFFDPPDDYEIVECKVDVFKAYGVELLMTPLDRANARHAAIDFYEANLDP